MSRSCQNLCLSQPVCLPTRCPIPCSVICCTPPVSSPSMPRVSRIQYKMACPPQCVPKPTKTVVYLPPCPTCCTASPKMEMTYLPPPPPPPCFYVCNTNCVPCPPSCLPLCPSPVSSNPPCKPQLCLPCPPC
ncbi:small proline-rich protein 2B isoform X2 [Monomorium pharaonis]|uniref:small proline-rich protein 2B isoform X2 n=1 Tax=Monomorium pharaonis TaxID=307658 RepID=UPI0017461CB6|nr:small proline-rich protein 2B isoform X2 [Monomorium pharaonis]